MPKRLTDEQRGPLATWIVRQREDRGWKQESMPGRLSDVGYGVRPDYYRQVEAGKKPGPDFLSALEKVFGTSYVEPKSATAPEPAPTPDMAALIAAMTRQTDAVADLLTEMRDLRRERANLAATVELASATINDLRGELVALRAEVEALRGRSAGTTPPARDARR